MVDSLYPEHTKLRALGGGNLFVGCFIDWLRDSGYYICEETEDSKNGNTVDPEYFPTFTRAEQLMFDHYGIDKGKFDLEKDRMLDAFREGAARAQ